MHNFKIRITYLFKKTFLYYLYDFLGKGTNDYILTQKDFEFIMNIFLNSPKVSVPVISVKRKKKNKKPSKLGFKKIPTFNIRTLLWNSRIIK